MSLLSPKNKWTPSGVPFRMIYNREREFAMNEDHITAAIAPRPPSIAEYREDVFNEVITGLTILMRAEQLRVDSSLGHWRGIDHALAYVKAMKEQEA